jgi:hypothetical protein
MQAESSQARAGGRAPCYVNPCCSIHGLAQLNNWQTPSRADRSSSSWTGSRASSPAGRWSGWQTSQVWEHAGMRIGWQKVWRQVEWLTD